MLFEVGSLNIYFSLFAIGTPLSCMRFFISAALSSAHSIACCHRFFGFQSSFGCIFVVFLHISSFQGRQLECWLSEDEVFATNSFTL